MKVGILGAGTWGTALAALLAKNGHGVTLWSAVAEEINSLRRDGAHKNLPGQVLPVGIDYTLSIEEACDCELLLFVVSSNYMRSTAARAARHIRRDTVIVSATKGVESGTLMTMTEVIEDELRSAFGEVRNSVAALSGPTHAEEVSLGLPASIVAACADETVSLRIADAFKNSCMRVYTNTDTLGVELCGALKNIIAIAAGINRGIGFGDNSGAMLMTRGIAEITRLGLKMGCRRETFMGLCGIGDLIVTCTSVHSRNNRCGELIASGKSYEQAQAEIGMVVEGYHALGAALALAEKYGVEMPIVNAVDAVINKGRPLIEVMRQLMGRSVKSELV